MLIKMRRLTARRSAIEIIAERCFALFSVFTALPLTAAERFEAFFHEAFTKGSFTDSSRGEIGMARVGLLGALCVVAVFWLGYSLGMLRATRRFEAAVRHLRNTLTEKV